MLRLISIPCILLVLFLLAAVGSAGGAKEYTASAVFAVR